MLANLLIGNQDIRIIQNCFHLIHISSHVCGDITSVKLHTFYQIQLCLHGLGFLDGDNAVVGNLFHRICNHLTNFIACCRNRCNSCDVVLAVDLAGSSSAMASTAHSVAFCIPFLKMIGFAPAARLLHACADHCLCQNSCGCGAVTCNVIGLCCNFFYQLCTHVLECIFQLDLFCDGHTIVGDQRSTVGFIQYYVSSLRSKGYSDGICQLINAGFQCCSALLRRI